MHNDPIHDAPLTYDEAKRLAQHHDVSVRRTLAEREDIRPEILFYLAGDPASEVRKAIAKNKATPTRAYIELARDQNDEIRSSLAEKIGRLAPSLTAHEVDRVQSYAYQALEILAHDQLAQIRTILADTLKDVAEAPEDVVKTLALDTELAVCVPILEHSPVLGDDDLMDIIASGLSSGALGAISNRRDVSASVSDAIVNTQDVSAITTLLCNNSAQVREETLDMLADQSSTVADWQGPLVHRPRLSNKAAQRLANFVAGNLLDSLQQRPDLSPETLAKVRDEVGRRLEENLDLPPLSGVDGESNQDLKKEFQWLFQQSGQVIAQNLKRMNRLTPQVVVNALNDGDNDFILAALAELSGVPLTVVQRIIAMRSGRGVAALCWKAGIDALTAMRIQARVAHVPADDIVRHAPDGGYSLPPADLHWQLNFFKEMAL